MKNANTKTVLAVAILFVVPSWATAQDTVDVLLKQLDAVVKQQVELAQKRADLAKDIAGRLKLLQAEFDRLNGNQPAPPPPAPPVDDPLAKKVKDAFLADVTQLDVKRADAVKLAALYEVAVEQKLCDDPTITTVKQLIDRIRAAGTVLAADRLAGVRKVLAEEMAAVLKSPDAPMDDQKRKDAHALFIRIGAALDAVSQ